MQHDIGRVAADPRNGAWASNSIEFCGGTHCSNTGEARAFVVTEETAVAKGVRRVVAVTGEVALQATRLGGSLESKVEAAAVLQGSALDSAVVDLRGELEALGPSIGLAVRSRARAKVEYLQRAVAAAKKAEASQKSAAGLVALEATLKRSCPEPFLVLEVDIGSDAKAVKKALEMAKSAGTPMLGLSRDADKVIAFAYVPPSAAGLAANSWIKSTLESCGGRGGGKADAAQGQASGVEDLSPIRAAAVACAESALSHAK